jgi:hypothetical protein
MAGMSQAGHTLRRHAGSTRRIVARRTPTGYRPSVGIVNSGPRRVPAVQRWVIAL